LNYCRTENRLIKGIMTALNSHRRDLAQFWKGRILWDSPMSQFSTLKVGGPAEAIIPVSNTEELKGLIRWLKKNNIDWWVIGRGSNILVPDSGLAGVIIVLEGEFLSIENLREPRHTPKEEKVYISAGGGCSLPRLVSYCTSQNLSGLEFAAGIPGSIGGAIVMNFCTENGPCHQIPFFSRQPLVLHQAAKTILKRFVENTRKCA
jgi:UDP-N-acetylmuramate dehydrogenase